MHIFNENKLINLENNLFLMKRGAVELVIELLKFACNIEHTRHRGPINAIVNIWTAIAAYHFFDKNPSILISRPVCRLTS